MNEPLFSPASAEWLSRDRFRQLADAIGRLVKAETREAVIEIVRRSARTLCGASGVAIVVREDEFCHYIAEDSEVPLWAGQRFPASHCISGWTMIHRQQAIIDDIYSDARIPHDAYRPTGVQSLVMTPVGLPEPYAALGAYWTRPHRPTPDEVASLTALSECMAAALQAIELRGDLQARLAQSERRRAQLEIARREMAVQGRLLDVVQQAVIASDLDGRVIYWNAFAEQLYGWTREEALGRTVIELKAAPDDLFASEALLQELQAGGSWTGELILARKDGSTFPAWVSDWPIRDEQGELIGIVGVSIDNTARRRAEDHQRLLINELNHRVKNTLAIVQSIAAQSLRGKAPDGARAAFESRLLALSAAHNLMVDAAWAPLSFHQVIATVLRPFGWDSPTNRFELQGAEVQLTPRTAISFTLALHELATNAVKYGALGGATGRVAFHWSVAGLGDDARFQAEWRERDGPPLAPSGHRGFGTRLLEQGLAAELDGRVTLEFGPAGLVCRIEAPAATALANAVAEPLFPLPAE